MYNAAMRMVALLLVLYVVGCSQIANARTAVSQKFIAQYTSVLRETLKADDEMFQQMQLVERKLCQFYGKLGHFPESEDEKAVFAKVVSKYIIGNPYRPEFTDRVTGEKIIEPYTVPLYIFSDPGITRQHLLAYIRKPPESWQADPGSIFVLTNGENLYLIWAAGADRLPIRDISTRELKARVIAKKISRTEN
jgi:hypothetical protein